MGPTKNEQTLDAVLDNTRVLSTTPDFDALELQRFMEDVAQKIHPPEVLAVRYGFGDVKTMVDYIRTNEELRRRIKARRSVWESNSSGDVRLREYWRQVMLEATPQASRPLFDDNASHSARIDVLKLGARIAGVDGLPPPPKDGIAGTGNQFTVNFHYSGDRKETITTVVEQPAALPAPDNA